METYYAQLTLTEPEFSALQTAVERRINELTNEIAHTEAKDYRHDLTVELDHMEKVRSRFGTAPFARQSA